MTSTFKAFCLVAALRGSFCVHAAASATHSPYEFGMQVNPTISLPVQAVVNNSTDSKRCVTVNGRQLCTSISSENCPAADTYTCDFFENESGSGNSCAFGPSDCSCTTTYDGVPCECEVTNYVPYWLSARARCVHGEHSIGGGDIWCDNPFHHFRRAEPKQNESQLAQLGACSRGSNSFYIPYLFQVSWDCEQKQPETNGDMQVEVMESSGGLFDPKKDCTCQASYNYKKCRSCEPCNSDEPGDFRAVCPGFFVDCFHTYSHWEEEEGKETSAGAEPKNLCMTVLMMVLFLTGSVAMGAFDMG